MKHRSLVFIILTLFIAASPAYCKEAEQASRLEFYSRAVKDDYSRFYLDEGNLLRLGAALGLSGVMANSAADREVREYYQDNIRGGATDTVASGARAAGEIFIMAPLLAATELYFDRSTPYGLWASRSLRAYAVGGPAGLLIQKATGGGRPAEGDSHWRAFDDNNGLSGHAFAGAVPLITAAMMQDDGILKALLYAASVLPALSRVNDDQHYASQAVAGWYLAYASVCAVYNDSEKTSDEKSFVVLPYEKNGIIAYFDWRF